MSYRLIYTDYAEENLRDIAFRIAQDDVETAIRYVEKIRKTADLLKETPDMGSMARYAPARKRGIRVLVIDKYLLQYMTDHTAKIVMVMKVSNGTQSYRRLFQLK